MNAYEMAEHVKKSKRQGWEAGVWARNGYTNEARWSAVASARHYRVVMNPSEGN